MNTQDFWNLGFSLGETGGGCTAYTLPINDRRQYVMVTGSSGCTVDDLAADDWIVALYDTLTDECVTCYWQENGETVAQIDGVNFYAGHAPNVPTSIRDALVSVGVAV